MPTVPDDPQQLQKKRHVGNDSVHIIYSEHGRDYSPKTITSQFNDAHLIVYPLPNGFYRIQIAKKDKVSLLLLLLWLLLWLFWWCILIAIVTIYHFTTFTRMINQPFNQVPTFGPLIHGMVVHKKLLPVLVRHTAINAHRYIRYNTEGYDKPFFTRYGMIQDIITKCTVKQGYEEFVVGVVKPEGATAPSSASNNNNNTTSDASDPSTK